MPQGSHPTQYIGQFGEAILAANHSTDTDKNKQHGKIRLTE